MDSPEVLIEQWLPTKELGIEAVRERAAASALPPLYFLHVWWARRPLVASSGAVLASLMPAWSADLASDFGNHRELASEAEYRDWFLRLCGILGNPAQADRLTRAARASGKRIPNPYTYPQAYKNRPTSEDLNLLHEILVATWAGIPVVADPTAGGGSIPFQAIRFGLPSLANDLNSVSAAILRSGVDLPSRYGESLTLNLKKWGEELCRRIEVRLAPFFPDGPDGKVATFFFARTVKCPRTKKLVPLSPNWWLSKGDESVAVRLVTERNGVELVTPAFEIARGRAIDRRLADNGTITSGDAVSPWDHLVIDGEYIKGEAQAGRMGSILYAVAVRTGRTRGFRAPTPTDLSAIAAADDALQRMLPSWEAMDVIPDEEFPRGNDMRPVIYGMPRWRDMFSPRQLLVHGTFVEEFRQLMPVVREAIDDPDRANAVLTLLALSQGKALNYNALLSSWHVSRQVMRSVFERHDFAFKSTYAEFEGARQLYGWSFAQVLDAYRGITELLEPSEEPLERDRASHAVPGPVTVTQGNAGHMPWIGDGSVELVCIDPPYYANVMYAELADFFYVWEKRTLGLIWPELFVDELTDKEQEAVRNVARFEHAGRRRNELATVDYERKMTAIFTECHRILRDGGVMTVMFTHKEAEAWDTLGQSLLEAGFTIEASWPVPTESEHSLHQAEKNAASSTIFLVCRKRTREPSSARTFFSSIEGNVRQTAREAYERFSASGIEGVDLLLATYGPALSVLSERWPVYSSEPDEQGRSRLLRPEEALKVARQEAVRLHRDRLVASHAEFDALTDFWLLAWDTFKAREFPFDEARKLALAVGGTDIEDIARAKLLKKRSGTVTLTEPISRLRRDSDSELPGVNRDRTGFAVLVDALHTSMYVLDQDGATAARNWLTQRRLLSDGRFRALLEAAVKAVPRGRKDGEFVLSEAALLERLVVACFPGIDLPEPEVTIAGQTSLQV